MQSLKVRQIEPGVVGPEAGGPDQKVDLLRAAVGALLDQRRDGHAAADRLVDAFDFGQVRFAEKRAISRRLEIYPANFHVERIFLRSYDQVGANGAQFTVDLVADIGGDGDHRGGHTSPHPSRSADSEYSSYPGNSTIALPTGRSPLSVRDASPTGDEVLREVAAALAALLISLTVGAMTAAPAPASVPTRVIAIVSRIGRPWAAMGQALARTRRYPEHRALALERMRILAGDRLDLTQALPRGRRVIHPSIHGPIRGIAGSACAPRGSAYC